MLRPTPCTLHPARRTSHPNPKTMKTRLSTLNTEQKTSRWSSRVSSKVNLSHSINFRALCGHVTPRKTGPNETLVLHRVLTLNTKQENTRGSGRAGSDHHKPYIQARNLRTESPNPKPDPPKHFTQNLKHECESETRKVREAADETPKYQIPKKTNPIPEPQSRSNRGGSLIRNTPPWDPTVGLCLGPYGGPMGGGCFL